MLVIIAVSVHIGLLASGVGAVAGVEQALPTSHELTVGSAD
jgi:hypothetical protein